jgi:hypothetical protein
MNTLSPTPYGHTESDLDKELSALGFTEEEISELYGAWHNEHSGGYLAFEKVVFEAINNKGRDTEDNVVRYMCTGFVPGETDSFGPLTRGCKIEFEDGRKVCAYYG